jgi:hypothetical protein
VVTTREFEVDAVTWIAEISGAAAVGGSAGPVIECVHLQPPDGADAGILRTYLPRGRFMHLDDAELRALHREAGPIQRRPAHETGQDPESPPGRERAVVEYPEPDDA